MSTEGMSTEVISPIEALQLIISKKQQAETCLLAEEAAKKLCQEAWAAAQRLIDTSVELKIVKLNKVYVIDVAGQKKAVRIIQKRNDRNGRDDEPINLKLEIMDMAE